MQVLGRKIDLGLLCLAPVDCGKEPKHEDLPDIMNPLGVALKIFDDDGTDHPYRTGMYIVHGHECSIADLSLVRGASSPSRAPFS